MNADENILWSGRPKQGYIVGPFELLRALFALYFLYPAILLVPTLFKDSNWVLTPLLFVLLGLAYEVAIGIVIRDKRRRDTTAFEITADHIIVRRKPSFFVDAKTSVSFEHLGTVTVQEHADGTGTIYLFDKTTPQSYRMVSRAIWKYLPPNVGLRNLGTAVVLERLPDYGVVAKLVESILSRHYTLRDAVIHGQQNVTV